MEKKRILVVCEPPLANTGFGTVARAILPALARDFEITLHATGGYGKLDNDSLKEFGVTAYQPTYPEDMHCIKAVDQIINTIRPHGVFSYYDSGSLYEFINNSNIGFYPHATYLVTESAPLMQSWCRMFDDKAYAEGASPINFTINEIVLASNYSNGVCENQTGRSCPVAYHGADHANWRRLPKEFKRAQRKELAATLGDPELENAFIVMYVARNADRKMWPRMLQALKLAQEMAPEIPFRLFAYTKKFDNFRNEGWMLDTMAAQFGLATKMVLYPTLEDVGGIPFDSDVPSQPTMIKHYNLADLYCHPSGVEGCGIPILEAARCGLPVLTTRFGAGWEYAQDFAMPIEVKDFYYHKSGIAHAMIDIEDCAKKIVNFARNKTLWHQYADAGPKRCNYKWADLGEAALEAMHRAIEKHPRMIK